MLDTFTAEIITDKNIPKDEIHWEYTCSSRKAVDLAVNEHRRLYSYKGYTPIKVKMIQFQDWVYGKKGAWIVHISNKINTIA
tara:strand:+ start:512 stop:757 length:246 start_codon:yes stop_codon:yes gene_type:complete